MGVADINWSPIFISWRFVIPAKVNKKWHLNFHFTKFFVILGAVLDGKKDMSKKPGRPTQAEYFLPALAILSFLEVSFRRSVWSKTTMIPGGVVGAGVDPSSWKMGTFFLDPWLLEISNQMELNGDVSNFFYLYNALLPVHCPQKVFPYLLVFML